MGMKPRSGNQVTGAQPSIWSVPVYLPYLQPPLTESAIRRIEEKLGLKLPAPYLALLCEQNGGYVRRTLPETGHSMIWGIGPRFPSIGGKWYEDFEDEDVWLPSDPSSLVPFDGDGHWYLALDFRPNGPTREPAVAYLDLECEVDQGVADDFSAFLNQLEEDLGEHCLGLVGISIRDALRRLESALETEFEPPDSWDHGYPIHRLRLAEKEPEWLWLSPNEAPRGFARKSDSRDNEGLELLPGTALRMPSFPEVDVILDCTEGAAARVKAACEQAGLQTVPLRPRGT